MAVIPYDLRDIKKAYFTHPSFQIHGRCTDFVSAYGVKFDAVLLIDNGLFTAGSTLTFTWGDNEVIMTLVNPLLVDDFGTLFDTDGSLFDFSASANAQLNADFEFLVTFNDFFSTVVTIAAREEGVAYNLTIVSSTAATSYLSETLGEDIVLNNNITVLCDVFKQKTLVDYDFKGTLKSALVFNGLSVSKQFNFELADFLHRNLSCELVDFTDYSENGLIVQANDSCREFKFGLRQSEGWDGVYNVDSYTVLRGGLSKIDYIVWRTDYFGRYTDSPVWRLMNWVKNYTQMFVEVTKNQKIWCCFFMNFEPANADINYDVYIDIIDVTNASDSALINNYDLANQSKQIVQYSYNDLDIDGIAASLSLGAVKNWTIRIYNVATLESYTVDYRELVPNDYREQFFVFENSAGSFQTIRTLGEHELGVEIDKDEFEKTVPVLSRVFQEFMVSETYVHTFKGQFFSGWLNIEDIYNFIDFLNSENIWKQDDHHQRMVQIKILKGSWTLEKKSNNGVHQYGFNVQYVETTRDKHVTDLIPY
jgi:hypothetical protein